MSVLIRGMEMPQKCGKCKLYHVEHPMHCMAVEGHRTVGAPYGMSRPDWCPLAEIPTPHGRLIDANKLMRDIEEYHLSDGKFQHWVDVQQTIIEAEGSEE